MEKAEKLKSLLGAKLDKFGAQREYPLAKVESEEENAMRKGIFMPMADGSSLGFAFYEFEAAKSAEKAVAELNNYKLDKVRTWFSSLI